MVSQVLDFLSDRARGFMLTMTGAGAGTLPEFLGADTLVSISLEPLQKIVLLLTGIVAILTITSYGYKFYKWCRTNLKKSESK